MRTFLLILLTAALLSCSAGRHDWPRWRGPNGDNISREKGWNPRALEGGPRVAWKANVGVGFSGVALRGNRLYTMGYESGLVSCCCLDASVGKEIWRHSYPSFVFPQATPTVDASEVYCLGRDGILFCLDAGNGKLRWERNLVSDCGAVEPHYGFAGSPVVAGRLLILTANTWGMALDKTTGEKVWISEEPPETVRSAYSTGTEYHSPVLYSTAGKQRVLICSWKGVFSVDVQTGKPLLLKDWEKIYWSFKTHVADPLVVGENVLIVGCQKQDQGSYLLDARGQEAGVLWKSEDTFSQLGSPVFFDGSLYVCQGDGVSNGSLRCLDAGTGKVMWEERLAGGKGKDSVSLTVADGKLIVLNDQGILSIAEASPRGFRAISSGDVLSGERTSREFWTPPVLCRGRIYCRNFAGDLVCIDVRK